MYTIYCHVFPNGKRYVGLTRTSVEKRWGKGKNYKTCLLVDRAINKYGWENIEHLVLETAETKEHAEEIERKYIKLFKSDDAEFGYNILHGGDVSTNDADDEMRYKLGNGWRGKHRSEAEKKAIAEGVRARFQRPESNGHFGHRMTEESKKKMSESQKKRWTDEMRQELSEKMRKRMADPEYKEKMISKLRTLPKRKKGEYHTSEETKKKLSEYNKGRYCGKNSPTSKPVSQYEKDGTFVRTWDSAGDAERAGIALRCNIGKVCRGFPSCHTAGGYIWRYEEEPCNE